MVAARSHHHLQWRSFQRGSEDAMGRTYPVSRAVVTGAAKGIGSAIAGRLAEEGFAVALLDIDREGAAARAVELEAGPGARTVGIACDVPGRPAVHRAFLEGA